MKLMLCALLLVTIAVPAAALEPGPDDELPLEEYERRIAIWCDGLVADYGWHRDPDGSVSGWPGGCWRPDDREHSHAECQAMGYAWDCPLPDPYPDPVPDDPYTVREPEPEPEPEPATEPEPVDDPAVSIDNTLHSVSALDWHVDNGCVASCLL